MSWGNSTWNLPALEALRLASFADQAAAVTRHLAPFAGSPLRELDLDAFLFDELPAWPNLAGLDRLTVRDRLRDERSSLTIDPDWLPKLAKATPNLRVFATDQDLRRPPPEGAWPGLDSLTLTRVTLREMIDGFAPILSRLVRLDASMWLLTTEDPAALANAAPNLKWLALRSLRGDHVRRLARATGFAALEVLDISDSEGKPPGALSAADVNALARAPFARNLKALVLGCLRNKETIAAAIKHFGPRCDAYWYSS